MPHGMEWMMKHRKWKIEYLLAERGDGSMVGMSMSMEQGAAAVEARRGALNLEDKVAVVVGNAEATITDGGKLPSNNELQRVARRVLRADNRYGVLQWRIWRFRGLQL